MRSLLASQDTYSQVQALVTVCELECALLDLAHPAAHMASVLTDEIARRGDSLSHISALERAQIPDTLMLNTPEGFAFYRLPILGYADLVKRLAHNRPMAVVGIRSAGVALSAITAAGCGSRMTVRPSGHPYDRELDLTPEQLEWVCRMLNEDRVFFVVDEGPGLSGSSFLATAEALEAAGVPRERIHLIGSNRCDPDRLVARGAAHRWRRFNFHVVPFLEAPQGTRNFSNGDWRSEFLRQQDSWPASWAQLTPPKYIAEDAASIWKFEGLGTHGHLAFLRARTLGQEGCAPRAIGRSGGFAIYERVLGEPLKHDDLDDAIMERMARYLAFIKSNSRYDCTSSSELERMTRHNVRQLLNIDLSDFELPLEHPVVCDARMMPYEWVRTENDQIIKTDAINHGDNHFFPGPCDIAWDVAGAIIEWRMSTQTGTKFMESYERETGDNIGKRLNSYVVAYSSFHAAYARMACNSINDPVEKARFGREFERYLSVLERAIQEIASSNAASQST